MLLYLLGRDVDAMKKENTETPLIDSKETDLQVNAEKTKYVPMSHELIHHHHLKRQGLDPLICSVSRVTTALANISLVFQLFSFLVVCSDMISQGFGLVAFFASVKASSHLN
jgi:hypothetical protein